MFALQEVFTRAVKSLFDLKFSDVNKEWRNFGRNQFQGSPSAFFANIAKEQKEKMAVEPCANGCFDPSIFLDDQSFAWAVHWDSMVDSCEDTFAPRFRRLRHYCIKHVTPPVASPELVDEFMTTYPKRAKGCDNQTSKEMVGYPPEAKKT